MRLSGKISKELKNKNIKLFAGPFIRYWNIPKSNNVSCYYEDKNGKVVDAFLYEPKNYTVEAGIKLGISF